MSYTRRKDFDCAVTVPEISLRDKKSIDDFIQDFFIIIYWCLPKERVYPPLLLSFSTFLMNHQ